MGHAHEDSPELPAPEVDDVIRGAVEWSFREQHERGYWVGTLESCCQLEVEFLMCLHVLGIEPSENKLAEAVVRRVRAKQRADGAWDIYPGAPAGDINTTIESYIALKLHGARVEEPAMAAARAWILAHGGISHRVRTFTKLWLALLGEWSWDDVPCLPPELIFLPHWAPFSVYQFSYWARQVIVPMAILCVRRPVHPLPAHLRCRELIRENELSSRDLQPSRKMVSFLDGILRHVDNALRWYGERCLVKPGRATAVECCVAWVLKRQECDGSWPVTTGWFLVLMALKTEGFPLDHPVMRSGVAAFDTVAAETEHGTIIQPGTSPTWDTVLTLLSMLDCGVDVRDARFARGVEYILSKEVRSRSGDWSLKVAPTVAASGWYFYHENEMYPDVDDTAVAMTVLSECLARGFPDTEGRVTAALERALRWITAMVSRNGAWGAFDKDNTSKLITAHPFCDFGEVLDAPSADVTAHVVETLGRMGRTLKDALVAKAVAYLRAEQEDDGSWFGRWGVNYVFGVGAVLPALQAVGEDMRAEYVQRACSWLLSRQNPDGGWGESCASYVDLQQRGVGPSTASQTAWALMALVSVRHSSEYYDAIRNGVEYLVRTRTAAGSWSDGGLFTGTGFPGNVVGTRIDLGTDSSKPGHGNELSRGYMLRYHMYPHYFPLMALGRARKYFQHVKSLPRSL